MKIWEYFGKPSDHSQKTFEVSLEAQFGDNQNKNTTTKNLRFFWKIFGEFLVNHRQTAGDPYLSKYPTILLPHFSQVYLSKQTKIYCLVNFRSNTAFGRSIGFGRTSD